MKMPRMTLFLVVTLLLVAAVIMTSPPPGQMDVQLWRIGLYKLSLATSAGWLGYWLDRGLFYYARPDSYLNVLGHPNMGCEMAFAASMQRRALIVAACIVGVALGA